MDQPYFTGSEKKSVFFYIATALMLMGTILSVNTDLAEYSRHLQLNIPQWFFNLIFMVDAGIVASIILIFLYCKAGVFSLPVLVLLHFLLHEFYLSTMLYSDLNLLFIYFAAGLTAVIPRWAYFTGKNVLKRKSHRSPAHYIK